jgi:hypothetical protein
MITLTDSISSILGVKVHNVRLNVNQGHQMFGDVAVPSVMRVGLFFSSFKEVPVERYGSVLISSWHKSDIEYNYYADLVRGENTALIFKQLAEVYAV